MRTMLKSKIHRARVTDGNISYEGSITIDKKLMEAADIFPYEKVDVLNINNGARFNTYAIEGKENSGADLFEWRRSQVSGEGRYCNHSDLSGC
jgi:aspartate 1-decarboxylase